MSVGSARGLQILFVEMQPAIVASSKTQDAASLKRAAAAVSAIANALTIPITASVVPMGDDAPTLIDELGALDVQTRTTISVFADDACRDRLAGNDRRTIALAGVSSEIAILHTAVDARRAGYEVFVLIDCCGGLAHRSEETALDQMRAAGVTITNISSFFTGLFTDMASPEGGAVMGALAELWSWGADAQSASIDQDVTRLFEEMSGAWQAGDAGRFAAVFAEEARFVAFDGTVLAGRREIADFHRQPFSSYLQGSSLILRPSSIKAVDHAAVLVASQGGITRDGNAQGDLIGDSAQTFVLARSRTGLKIQSFQNTRIRPLTQTGAAEAWQAFDRAWRDRELAS